MKLTTKILLGLLIVGLLFGVTAYSVITTSKKTLEDSIGDNTILLAQQTIDQIDRSLYSRIDEWQAYASSNQALHQALADSNQQFQDQPDRDQLISQKDQQWQAAAKDQLTDLAQSLLNNSLSQELKHRLEYYQHQWDYPVFGEVFVTNKYGVNVAQSDLTSDYYQADEAWWQQAVAQGLSIDDVSYDDSSQVYSISVGIKVLDSDNQLSGVVKVVINLQDTIQIVDQSLNSRKADLTSGFVTLVDQQGRVIYSTRPFALFEPVESDLWSLFGQHQTKTMKSVVVANLTDGSQYLVAHTHSHGFRQYSGLSWSVLMGYQTREIFAPVNFMARIISITALISYILATTAGLFIGWQIVRPVRQLQQAALAVSQGKFNVRVQEGSKDEFGQLARAFNQMAASLDQFNSKQQQYRQNLEQQVSSGTQELDQKVQELERLNRLMVGREMKMIELKNENQKLQEQLDQGKITPPVTESRSNENASYDAGTAPTTPEKPKIQTTGRR